MDIDRRGNAEDLSSPDAKRAMEVRLGYLSNLGACPKRVPAIVNLYVNSRSAARQVSLCLSEWPMVNFRVHWWETLKGT